MRICVIPAAISCWDQVFGSALSPMGSIALTLSTHFSRRQHTTVVITSSE